MFLKIFKYDFKAVFFKYLLLLIFSLILALLVRIFDLVFKDISVLFYVYLFLVSLFVLDCIGLIVFAFILCVSRYARSLFSDEGYLTHTLPISKHYLLLSHLLVGILMGFIAYGMLILCVFIAIDVNSIRLVFQIIATIFQVIYQNQFLLLGNVTMFFNFLMSLLIIYLGVGIGYGFSKNKQIQAIIFCVILNLGFSLIKQIMHGIFSNIDLKYYIYVEMSSSILFCVGAYFFNIYVLKNKLNLE